jgi:hypothetical protein
MFCPTLGHSGSDTDHRTVDTAELIVRSQPIFFRKAEGNFFIRCQSNPFFSLESTTCAKFG